MDWIIQTSDKSRCSQCQEPLDILTNDKPRSKMFFICWNCKKVFIAGEGEVPREG